MYNDALQKKVWENNVFKMSCKLIAGLVIVTNAAIYGVIGGMGMYEAGKSDTPDLDKQITQAYSENKGWLLGGLGVLVLGAAAIGVGYKATEAYEKDKERKKLKEDAEFNVWAQSNGMTMLNSPGALEKAIDSIKKDKRQPG